MNRKKWFAWAAILLLTPICALAATFPDKPPSEHFYVDEAGLIDARAGAKIDEIASALLAEENIPLYVVTIPALAVQDAVTMRIEEYAAALFNHWGIGWEDRNYGILLLVSEGDRKARIELGADWGGAHNYEAGQIMNDLIIPGFKRGDYATGIADGVRGLDAMARGLSLPKPQGPWWVIPAVLGGIALMVMLIINLFRSGRKGWAWVLLGILGVVLLFIIQILLSADSSSDGGSGGGFGGGFSGGGGATGSW
ncbi:TPM domain-containing protein [Desulfoluna butyratoxydans]|uniref:Tpm domain n=1 Tax=Desulfoluna butyratoxydans TaxID=231438 RepID=A0A4U8YR81_9BACT|nr:TPM domain-containing protein [Desulfoluna butyratoxydans]VFQ46796.1 tpm domain [Desulfoluna butyratoxydans]